MEAEVTMYDAQVKKLQGLCDEHDLVFKLEKETYPIRLTISQVQKQYEQGTLMPDMKKEEDKSDPNAKMVMVFKDGHICTKFEDGTFVITDVLQTKIKNIFVKIVAYWQQFFFRDVITRNSLKKNFMPVMPSVDEVMEAEGEPVEDFED